MKKTITLFILALFANSANSQSINPDYFPLDNWIDSQYEIEIQNWKTNAEWIDIINKYREIWENQIKCEMNRLFSILPTEKTSIIKMQEYWESVLAQSIKTINENVDFNKTGREPYIEYLHSIMNEYRSRAIYYFCLYYTLLEMNPDYNIKSIKILATN